MKVSSGILHVASWEVELRKPAQENASPKADATTVSDIKVFVFDPEVLHL